MFWFAKSAFGAPTGEGERPHTCPDDDTKYPGLTLTCDSLMAHNGVRTCRARAQRSAGWLAGGRGAGGADGARVGGA